MGRRVTFVVTKAGARVAPERRNLSVDDRPALRRQNCWCSVAVSVLATGRAFPHALASINASAAVSLQIPTCLFAEQRCLQTSGQGRHLAKADYCDEGTGHPQSPRTDARLGSGSTPVRAARIFLSLASTQGDRTGGTLRHDCTDQRELC